MPVTFFTHGTTGLSVAATVQAVDTDGTLGDYWDENAGAWAAAPSDADQRISMAEGTGQNLGSYFANKASLGTVTTKAVVRFVNTTLGQTVGSSTILIVNGEEAPGGSSGSVVVSPEHVGEARTFKLDPLISTTTAWNATSSSRFKVAASTNGVFAFDLTDMLNPNTDLTGVTSCSDSENPGNITIGGLAIDQTRRQAHVNLSGLSATNSHALRCVVTTTDSQSLAVLAYITVE